MGGYFTSSGVEAIDISVSTVHGFHPRVSLLYWSYGLSQASATAVDNLILIFAARVLNAQSADIGLLDAVGTLAYTLATLALGLLWKGTRVTKLLTALGFLSLAGSIFLFSSVGTLWMAYALVILFSALMVVPNAVTVGYLSGNRTPSQLAALYGRLGASGSLGSVLGLLIAVLWLAIAYQFGTAGLGERTLFLAMGVTMVLATAGVWAATRRAVAGQTTPRRFSSPGNSTRVQGMWTSRWSPPKPFALAKSPTEPMLNDALVVYLLLMFLLNSAVGIYFTGTFLYMVTELNAAAYIVLLGILAFRFASFLVSEPAGDHLNRLLPLRFQQIADFWRLLAVASMGLIALLPNGLWCLTAVLFLLVVSGISNGITGVTGPVAASATVSSSKQSKAYLLTMAASLGGTGLGAWSAAILVPTLGFPILFGIGALVFSISLLLWHRL